MEEPSCRRLKFVGEVYLKEIESVQMEKHFRMFFCFGHFLFLDFYIEGTNVVKLAYGILSDL